MNAEIRRICRYISGARQEVGLFMRGLVILAVFLSLALPVHAATRRPAAPAQKAVRPPPHHLAEKSAGDEILVARIDGIIATQHKQALRIQVRGAVPGGGWKAPHLRVTKGTLPADAHTVVVEFVATPPPPGSAVITGLLPVSAEVTLQVRKGQVSARAVSGSNEITTQILK